MVSAAAPWHEDARIVTRTRVFLSAVGTLTEGQFNETVSCKENENGPKDGWTHTFGQKTFDSWSVEEAANTLGLLLELVSHVLPE